MQIPLPPQILFSSPKIQSIRYVRICLSLPTLSKWPAPRHSIRDIIRIHSSPAPLLTVDWDFCGLRKVGNFFRPNELNFPEANQKKQLSSRKYLFAEGMTFQTLNS